MPDTHHTDPLYHRTRYAKHREHILAWRKSPEQIAKQKAYKAANRERYREANRRYKERHREALLANTQTPEYKAMKAKHSRKCLLKQYGLTELQYSAMLLAQGHRCAICGTTDPAGRRRCFHIDHCHASGRTRGLLCTNCNTAIGMLGDDPARLFKAAQYVLSYQDVPEVS